MQSVDFKLFTLEEVATITHSSLATVRYWRATGRLRVTKPGRHPLVTAAELARFLGMEPAEDGPGKH
jgi:excisionase family DNA binding protein